jgi:heme oxygenase
MAVEKLPFVQYLLKGNITEPHYVVYLFEMSSIYRHLEQLAEQAGLLDTLPGLARANRITEDLQQLHPGYSGTLCSSTVQYLAYLTDLYNSDRKHQLFAHIYVRHLGDMYGGKLIARVVPGSGRWYEFDNRVELLKNFNAMLSMDLADEALVAFEQYGNIFKDLWNKIHTV